MGSSFVFRLDLLGCRLVCVEGCRPRVGYDRGVCWQSHRCLLHAMGWGEIEMTSLLRPG